MPRLNPTAAQSSSAAPLMHGTQLWPNATAPTCGTASAATTAVPLRHWHKKQRPVPPPPTAFELHGYSPLPRGTTHDTQKEDRDVMKNQIAENGDVIFIDPLPNRGYILNNFNIVGKVITRRELSFTLIRANLMGIWGNPKNIAIIEVGRNKVLISFSDHEKGRQVLKKGPWSIRGYLLNLRWWTGVEPISQ
ncbi:hypothetical protein PIB30_103011 [Stylosanthes scabra]|uniref:DUF4283 domain-containing protein n=1 Tax=Stylosanthes scabra TaxID=79078 RepID=A0ABU6T091_9FABA|nr:hypothetical protein [Stylosanthes scabra]